MPARKEVSASLSFILAEDVGEDRQGHEASDTAGSYINLASLVGDPLALARALSTSPLWQDMPGAILLARPSPRPALGVIGRFDAANKKRLAVLGSQLADELARMRYVTYSQAEEDCERLAVQLVERFGRGELRRFCFTAIPRGGLIVLGMLAYVVGLEYDQLEPPHPPHAPLVVVDDCALSGSRFGRFLARCENRHVVFAHLYSHPDLRAAVEAREPRVIACLGARDLHDHAPDRLGEEYAAWRERWVARRHGPRYWFGQADYVAFPWSEPDLAFWNPVTKRIERGWRIVPPELCLRNRPKPGVEPIPVQIQPEGPGPLRPSSRVLFGEFEGHIVIGNTETKSSFSLAGVAADMWRKVTECGNLEDAVMSLSTGYDVNEATLRADLESFVEDLLARDLLEESDASAF